MVNCLQYSLNEGYRGACGGATLGGSLGYHMGSKYTLGTNSNDPCHLDKSIRCEFELGPVVYPVFGAMAGSLLGFTVGTAYGLRKWMSEGPQPLQNDRFLRLGQRADFQALSINAGEILVKTTLLLVALNIPLYAVKK